MKKRIILIAAIMLAGALAFGETGYKKLEWNCYYFEAKEKLLKQKPLNTEEEKIQGENLIITQNTILGEQNEIYYIFSGGYLYGIAYTIKTEKSNELKEKFTKIVETTKEKTLIKNDFFNELREDNPKLNPENYWKLELCQRMILGSAAAELAGPEIFSKEGSCTISIYDYNDDTRVYIYENIMEGQTVVVYVPHEQDF